MEHHFFKNCQKNCCLKWTKVLGILAIVKMTIKKTPIKVDEFKSTYPKMHFGQKYQSKKLHFFVMNQKPAPTQCSSTIPI